jgi:hypothetical protein
MSIKAEVHTDCRTAEAKFDATHWFEQATDNEILDLADCGWGGDFASDAVAEYYNDTASDPAVEEVFKVLHILRRKEDIGFECNVDETDALAWVKEHRPWLHAIIVEQAEEQAFVCTYTLADILNLTSKGLPIREKLRLLARKEASDAIPDKFGAGVKCVPSFHVNQHESKVYIVLRPEQGSKLDPEGHLTVEDIIREISGNPPDENKVHAAEKALAGLVTSILSSEALKINARGLESQITYLLENEETAETIIKRARSQEKP